MINTHVLADTPTLIGERIRLVPLGPEHVDAVFDPLDDPEARRLTGTHRTFTREDIVHFCASRAEQDDRLDWAIESLDTGEYAGGMAFNGVDPDNESGGFRIDLVTKYRGQGIGPEAIGLMLGYVFEEVGMHRVSLEVFSFNHRAQRSYEKAGFVLEGRMRDALVWEGERFDTLVMSILRPEWAAGQNA